MPGTVLCPGDAGMKINFLPLCSFQSRGKAGQAPVSQSPEPTSWFPSDSILFMSIFSLPFHLRCLTYQSYGELRMTEKVLLSVIRNKQKPNPCVLSISLIKITELVSLTDFSSQDSTSLQREASSASDLPPPFL